ncbi:metallophosphoesterase family protein [Labilibacter marinus]|uniref:metallophosphoesterase family protein n=1 Tax=Labilibacter marinus TaxID=1477105 RepID=UPI00094F904F|nr:exonuclease subunit SbcD [Labilibacter marinus]
MKILHTADWHIGKKLESYNRIEEQKLVLEEICTIANNEKVDAIIIAGDLFDTFNPSSEAVELFYQTLKKLTKQGTVPVIAISGNHDSPDRIETADPLARECGIFFIGYPDSNVKPFELDTGVKVIASAPGFIELKLPDTKYPLRIITTPYANEYRIKQILKPEDKETELRALLQEDWQNIADKYCDTEGVNILATHLFVINKGEKPQEEPDDEKPILHVGGAQAIFTENFPQQIQYVALGHLHRKQIIASIKHPVAYSGSPLSYSFAEANQQKYVMIVDIEPNQEAKVSAIELKQGKKLVRLKAKGMEEAEFLLADHQNCLVELTLETDEYISAKDRQLLHQLHAGIITLIPQITNKNKLDSKFNTIDINQDFKSLFADYFKHTNNGLAPNENILSLLNEVVAEKE